MISYRKFLRSIVAKITSSDELFLFWTTLLYCFLSIFNLNNKTLFGSLCLLFLAYNWYLKNFRLSLIYTAITSVIYLVGKTWIWQLIPPELLRSSNYPRGYEAVVVITPFQIICGLIFLFILRDLILNTGQVREKILTLFRKKELILISLFFYWQLISAIINANYNNLPQIYALQSLLILICFVGLKIYTNQKSYNWSLISILGAISLFEAALASWQWLHKSTSGLVIEAIYQSLSYFQGVDENFFSVRPVGTFSNANELGIFAAILLPVFLSLLYLPRESINQYLSKKYIFSFMVSTILLLVLSQSRAAWLSGFTAIAIMLFFIEKRWRRYFFSINSIKLTFRYLLIVFMVILTFLLVIAPRITSSYNLFQPTGGGESRLELMQEAVNIIRLGPIFGTGMGLSGVAMFGLNPEGIIAQLPVVHNYYFLIAAESGLPALILFILFIIGWARTFINQLHLSRVNDKIRILGIIMAVVAALISSLLHQIFLMSIFFIIIAIGNIDYVSQTNKKA